MKPFNCKKGSAWHDWQKAGYEWKKQTYATSEGAILLAANAFASLSYSDNERGAKRRAFIEGVRFCED